MASCTGTQGKLPRRMGLWLVLVPGVYFQDLGLRNQAQQLNSERAVPMQGTGLKHTGLIASAPAGVVSDTAASAGSGRVRIRLGSGWSGPQSFRYSHSGCQPPSTRQGTAVEQAHRYVDQNGLLRTAKGPVSKPAVTPD